MSKEVKQMVIQLKEILNKYPNKRIEILSYVFGKDNLRKIINQPTYDELQQENQQLKVNCNIGNENLKFYMQENKQLKLDYELYKDNCVCRNYEVEKRDNTIKQLKEVIEKANNELITLIQIIMEQPSKNVEEDNYLLSRLESISNILVGGNNE